MYRWQTLTLAKIEARAAELKTTPVQTGTAKQVLLAIGIQHFLEPTIRYGLPIDLHGGGFHHDLFLAWEVDGRKIEVAIRSGDAAGHPPACWFGFEGSDFNQSRTTGIHEAVQYLLFGDWPGANEKKALGVDEVAYLETGQV